jgi:nucleoid-associated protein YejK
MFENLTVDRLTLHHVFKRGSGGERVTPIYAEAVFKPEGEIKRVIEQRLVSAVGNSSRAMTVDIVRCGSGTTFQLSRQATMAEDSEYLAISAQITDALADAQVTQVPPEGFLFIVDGSAGYPAKPFLALMKAEPQSGFSIDETDTISLTLLDKLVLTPASKLYKVGLFMQEDSSLSNEMDSKGWSAVMYDQRMSQSDRHKASIYFYDAFLGCAIPKDSAYLTKRFYELTNHYVKNASLTPAEQADAKTALYAYLKVDATPTISVDEFANRYFAEDPDRVTDFKKYMKASEFSDTAFAKDVRDISSQLKKRTVSFPSGIRLTGSIESFEEKVTFTYEQAKDTGKNYDRTIIEIKENPTEA